VFPSPELKLSEMRRTPLYDLHVELGAKMVPFASYMMPVQYPSGVLKEHLQTRARAGLFDVSHMGQMHLLGDHAANALESLVPVDIVGLERNQQRYALLTDTQGGILDDLMVTRIDGGLAIVVNAACKVDDEAHLQSQIGDRCKIVPRPEFALLALQGPTAADVIARLSPSTDLAGFLFMQARQMTIAGISAFVTRSGYTGEDGFEISVPNEEALRLARALLADPEVAPIGLGARDSLRLEAGLCLYGHDLDTNTTPVEGSLTWAISKARRTGGARAGGFLGADVILSQLETPPSRKRVGLVPLERIPVREGVTLCDDSGQVIGRVTSGGFGPSLNGPLAMGYVPLELSSPGSRIFAMVRDRKVELTVVKTPFVPSRYYRG
jgi:aminomethyltransferase